MIERAFGNLRLENLVPKDAAKGKGEEEGCGEVEGRADVEVSEQSQECCVEQCESMQGAWFTEVGL